ncbi:SRPBCC family protein [Arthrobacter sp. AL08]|uniref:SRPBCC family protein n=1 Tax=Micrococcaceae TaxID=1268 RepID=UPI002096C137|nr:MULTISPECIES: SRPBCC family protein [Micrococcaceae]MDD1475587.1 SRPBCC family protein [Arthrobacter sp. H16F315]MDI3242135.1 SRPBCC family protein [Arthrobacter sp. AL05]MDI3278260.1 SRPBCC family protein [Arthrobacter sp. AL08]MDJ0353272.1 SRPBCC family protein [Pseudarthrobacter sp. PH31-O2]
MRNALTLTVPDGLPFIDFGRDFDFPVSEVFRAHQDPELVARWLGPRRVSMSIDHYDFRTGGSYRYTHTAPDGSAYGFSGVFHTVRENEFAIQTFEFDGYPDVVSIEFLSFEDLGGGRTRLSGHAVYPSLEARDGMAKSGMEGGMSEGYERLEEVLAGDPG